MYQRNSAFTRSWSNFQNAFRLAMASIRAQKLRSFLTLLGVIIGVASVIMVGAAIEGLDVYAEQSTAKATPAAPTKSAFARPSAPAAATSSDSSWLVPSLPSKVPMWALVTGFSVSVIIGVFFGVWPAMKASQLDPVKALRYE